MAVAKTSISSPNHLTFYKHSSSSRGCVSLTGTHFFVSCHNFLPSSLILVGSIVGSCWRCPPFKLHPSALVFRKHENTSFSHCGVGHCSRPRFVLRGTSPHWMTLTYLEDVHYVHLQDTKTPSRRVKPVEISHDLSFSLSGDHHV